MQLSISATLLRPIHTGRVHGRAHG